MGKKSIFIGSDYAYLARYRQNNSSEFTEKTD